MSARRRGIAGLQARGERDLDVAAAAAGDGAVDDLHVGVPALNALSNTSKAGCSEGDTHHDTTSSRLVGSEKLAFCPPPPHAASTTARKMIQ